MDTVESEGLLLRPLMDKDALSVHDVIGNDSDMTWDRTARPLERTKETLRGRMKHYEDHGFGIWAVIDKNSNELVGMAGLQMFEGTSGVELVVYIAKRRWRQGVAFEACSASLRYGFEEMGLSRIVANTRTDNVGAQQLLTKLGF